ncbi:chitinase-3-like protein 1 [Lucilia cuprina]|uniref:chitinase-3-like protein 1 n=1 Tax=Lucilia cuprina TaxID=7375 RepID=UPI001F05F8CA|nr:chitinase-3-like protein 1 [Lucilia cuprina]
MANYELIDETNGVRYKHIGWRIALLVSLCMCSTALVYRIWQHIYGPYYTVILRYPQFKQSIPPEWIDRATVYSLAYQNQTQESHDFRLVKNLTFRIKYLHSEQDENSSLEASSIFAPLPNETLVVCYYTYSNENTQYENLNLTQVNGTLCTHINVGMAFIKNSSIVISQSLNYTLSNDMPRLKTQFPHLKFLLCIGGGGSLSDGFSDMIRNHQSRKVFIQSLKEVLRNYKLDGCDLDWEFPSAYNRERMHFSQLLYEIRQEYVREKRAYLLSVAVAAPEGIALFAYDVAEINKYADHVNLMSYDYHFYTKGTPFTGLNAPLYARSNEHSILATLNINYSVNWWLKNGLERRKLIVGLPTYGHSFTLINPFNTAIGAPASGYGHTGNQGFVSSGEICWFLQHNILSSLEYDKDACSCYASSANEWIAFDQATSLACKAKYIKMHGLGGAMMFSLNTDDFKGICVEGKRFPSIEVVYKILKNV